MFFHSTISKTKNALSSADLVRALEPRAHQRIGDFDIAAHPFTVGKPVDTLGADKRGPPRCRVANAAFVPNAFVRAGALPVCTRNETGIDSAEETQTKSRKQTHTLTVVPSI